MFQNLDGALFSNLVEYRDEIYHDLQHFRLGCNIRKIVEIIDRYNLKSPSGLELGIPECKIDVWKQLVEMSRAPGAVSAPQTAATTSPRLPPGKTGRTRSPIIQKRPGGGTKVKYSDSAVITVLIDKNPKRGTAAVRFNLYRTGMTVGEYILAGGLRTDVNWDSNPRNGWIRVEQPKS